MNFKKIISTKGEYEFCFNLLLYDYNLPGDIKRIAEEKCLEYSYWAYRLRKDVKGVPEHIKFCP